MKRFVAMVAVVLACTSGAQADMVMETVPVGNAGNANDTHGGGYGGVDYAYNIGKYEVTAGQYCAFLNAVAATDTYGLYNRGMWSNSLGCKIERTGSPGAHTYSVAADWVDRPVNLVSWGDAVRFANWMHNGEGSGDTEDGSYFLDGAMSDAELLAITREPDATWVIPTEDEWYKAAYHKNDGVTGNYFDYTTSSDNVPGYVNNSGNLSGTGTPFTEGGTDPGNYATYDGDGGADGIGSPYYRTEVGEWENSDSPYSTFDQGGNLWEWNETQYGDWARGRRGGAFNYHGGGLRAATRHGGFPAGDLIMYGFRVARVAEPAPLSLDIKPGSCPNPLNRNSNGVLPVSLLGSPDFDVTQVDISSLSISRADGVGGSVAPNEGPPGPHTVIEDVGTPLDATTCGCHDLTTDGLDDLVMHFRTQDVVNTLGLDGLNGGDEVELTVSGTLLDGTPFTASDCILIVPPGNGRGE